MHKQTLRNNMVFPYHLQYMDGKTWTEKNVYLLLCAHGINKRLSTFWRYTSWCTLTPWSMKTSGERPSVALVFWWPLYVPNYRYTCPSIKSDHFVLFTYCRIVKIFSSEKTMLSATLLTPELFGISLSSVLA